MGKFVLQIEQCVESEELIQMVYSLNTLASAFSRMIESKEIQGYLAEYLEEIKKEAEEENIEFSARMEANFYKEIREILILEIYRDALQEAIEKIHTNGLFPIEIQQIIYRMIVNDETNKKGKYHGIIEKYLAPLNENKKAKAKKPPKTKVQQMLAIISAD